MGYTLAPSVTYCVAGGRYFFLDLHQDRYTCLSARAQQAFMRLETENAFAAVDTQALEALVVGGVLSFVENSVAPRPCKGSQPATRSIHRHAGYSCPSLHALGAATNLYRMKRAVVRGGLEPQATIIRTAKHRLSKTEEVDLDRVGRIARSYELAGLAFSLNDNCLTWSLTLAKSMLRCGIHVDVIFGVMARPFLAHCWVQAGNTVLNEEVERTEQFTPILVL